MFEQKAPILLYVIDVVDGHLIKEEGEFGRWVLITSNNEKIYKIRINGTIVDKYHSASDGTKKAFTTLTFYYW
jgi:RPA family protein